MALGKQAWNCATIKIRNSGHSQRRSNARSLTIMPRRKVEILRAWGSIILIKTRSEEPVETLR